MREIIKRLALFIINFILIMIILVLHDYDKESLLILLLWIMAFVNYVFAEVVRN